MLHDGDDERNSVPRTRPARCQYCSALALLGPHRVSLGAQLDSATFMALLCRGQFGFSGSRSRETSGPELSRVRLRTFLAGFRIPANVCHCLRLRTNRTTPENTSTTASSAVLRTHRGTAWSCGGRKRLETSLQLQAVAHITSQGCLTKWCCPIKNGKLRGKPTNCRNPHRFTVGIVFAFAHIGYSEAKAGPKSARPRLTSIARIDTR